jgi:hypothetical protein
VAREHDHDYVVVNTAFEVCEHCGDTRRRAAVERRVVRPPVTRRSDPVTSAQAEAAINRSGGRETIMVRVYDAVKTEPGQCRGEIAESLELSEPQVWRRLSDLKSRGLIYVDGTRDWRGHSQSLWWPVHQKSAEQSRLI